MITTGQILNMGVTEIIKRSSRRYHMACGGVNGWLNKSLAKWCDVMCRNYMSTIDRFMN